MSVRRRPLLVLALAVSTVVGSCAASEPAGSARQPSGAPLAAAPVVTETVAALATDQACTRRAPQGAALRSVPLRTDDLAAMTLPKRALGSAVRTYAVDWWHWGYQDNAELRHIDVAPPNLCRLNRERGRITGFSRAYSGSHTVSTSASLFFTGDGAASWLRRYVAGMKAVPGTQDVTAVNVRRLSGVATDAVQLRVSCSTGCRLTWLLFRNGPVVGAVFDGGPAGSAPVVAMRDLARRLDRRIGDRAELAAARGAQPVDAVVALSAGLPRGMLGDRYRRMVWDWFYGGCWDPTEAASQTATAGERRHYLADASRFGQLTFCRAMYVPPGDQAAVNGVSRVFTGGTLYATAEGASDAIAETVRDWAARAGSTVGGTSYGRLVRFDPGDLGGDAVGLRQRAGDSTYVRVLFRVDRYVAVAALTASAFAGMTGDVREWARRLDRRVTRLTTSRTF